MTVETDLADLKQRLQAIEDLRGAEAVLNWDLATYMPPRGAEARGRQLALLSSLAHQQLTDPAIGRLLDSVTPWAEVQGIDSDAAALVRVPRRDYDRGAEPRARGVPSRLRASLRRAHRPRRGRHDGAGGARAFQRPTRRPGTV